MLDFNTLIKFIDDYSNQQLYWQVDIEKVKIEIQWNAREWRIRPVGALFWHIVNGSSLEETLKLYGINELDVKNQFIASCMELIVGAHFMLEVGRKTFGDEAVEESIIAYDEFGQKLVAMLNETLEDKTGKDTVAAHLKLVKLPEEH
jgi:hypothetical protein